MTTAIQPTETPDWIIHHHTPSTPQLQLLCFPHAGGSASTFRNWDTLAPSGLRIAAVQLPGRDRRSGEPSARTTSAMAASLGRALATRPNISPWVFFGHSLGGLLAFETIRWLALNGYQPPEQLVLASAVPPHLMSTVPLFSMRGRPLLDELGRLGGLPHTLQRNPRLAALWLSRLEADLDMAINYEIDQPCRIPCPITIIAGDDDRLVPESTVAQWNRYTTETAITQTWPGGHFAVLNNPTIVLCNAVAGTPTSGNSTAIGRAISSTH